MDTDKYGQMQTNPEKSGQIKTNQDNCSHENGPSKPSNDAINDLTISPIGARILWLLNAWQRRTMTDFERDIILSSDARRGVIKLRLRDLIRRGHVKRHGRGKATWYTR
jgi:hypothetical protein